MTQIQIIVLKLIPRLISFMYANNLSPSFLFHSPSSARKFLVKYCHKSKQVLASSVMNTTFNFLSEKGLCLTAETDRKCNSVKYIFSSVERTHFICLREKSFLSLGAFTGTWEDWGRHLYDTWFYNLIYSVDTKYVRLCFIILH